MNQSPYNFSFTAGGLLVAESLMVADVHEQCQDWAAASERIQRDNLLQARTVRTADTKLREIRTRLQMLTSDQLQLLATGGRSEQLALLWLAVCKRYAFVADFARQVVRELYLSMKPQLTLLQCEDFLERQIVWHEEIERLTAQTRRKVCTVCMRMLREAEITTDQGLIEPTLLSRDVAEAIASDHRDWFLIYPIAVSDIPGAVA